MERMENAEVDLANLSLADDEEEGLVFNGEEEVLYAQKGDYSHYLVGRFLTERPVNFEAMKNTMASLWRPEEGMLVRDLGNGLYVFQFGAKSEMNRVIDMSPWSYNNHALLLEVGKGDVDPSEIPLNHLHIWVQIHGLKRGFSRRR